MLADKISFVAFISFLPSCGRYDSTAVSWSTFLRLPLGAGAILGV